MRIPDSIKCPICGEKMGKISNTENKEYLFKFDMMEIKTKEGKVLTPKVQLFLCPECNNIQQHLIMYDSK